MNYDSVQFCRVSELSGMDNTVKVLQNKDEVDMTTL